MQRGNLNLYQNLFVRLCEEPGQAFYEWIVHASPFLDCGPNGGAFPRSRGRDRTRLTRQFSQRSQSFYEWVLSFLAFIISVFQSIRNRKTRVEISGLAADGRAMARRATARWYGISGGYAAETRKRRIPRVWHWGVPANLAGGIARGWSPIRKQAPFHHEPCSNATITSPPIPLPSFHATKNPRTLPNPAPARPRALTPCPMRT
jgi:hypothetical protein